MLGFFLSFVAESHPGFISLLWSKGWALLAIDRYLVVFLVYYFIIFK